jgi:hypothetical protein
MMTKTLSTLFLTSILLTATIVASTNMFEAAEAIQAKGTTSHHSPSKKVCGDQLCSKIKAKPPVSSNATKPEPTPEPVTEPTPEPVTEPTPEPVTEPTPEPSVSELKPHSRKTMTGTITSVQDPGQGHDSHQLAIILPPSNQTYSGILTYSASESVQLVALHGPLAEGEDVGQAIWTTDGKTKYALTLVDPKTSTGSWEFAGNALAVHAETNEPFTVSYSVAAKQ